MDNSEAQHNQQKHPNQLFIPAAHTQVLDQYPLPALVLQTSHSFPLQSTTVSVSASDYLCLFSSLILAMCDAKHM